jgi:hypothetical protein
MNGSHDSPLERFLRDPGHELARTAAAIAHTLVHLLPVIGAVSAIVVALVIARVVLARLRERRLARDARLLQLAVPPDVDADGALLLWSALHDLLRPRSRAPAHRPATTRLGDRRRPRRQPLPHLDPRLGAARPGRTRPQRRLARHHHHNGRGRRVMPRTSTDASVATELVLSGPEWFPLGGEQGPDPLRLVLAQLAGLSDGEQALVQIVARPATAREQRRLLAAARRIRSGAPPSRLLRLLEFLLSSRPRRTPVDPTVSPDVRAVLEKASHPLYRCLIRLSVSAADARAARGRMHALAGAFAAYEGRVGLRRQRAFGAERKLRLRTLGRRGYLLSIPELATLAHLPAEQALSGLLRAGARSVTPPPGLPEAGKPLGLGSGDRPVALAVADARYHLHLLGPTGVGKSTLIARLVLDDLAAGRGAVVIDPKGDLVEEILARVPDGAEERVDLLDPLDPQPPGLNVLEGADHDLVVDQLVGIFRRVYERFWGPRTDDILRAALLTLLDGDVDATLADVPRLLTDEHWRGQLLDELEDPVGLEPFWEWYDGLGEAVRAQATGPVLNKLRAFLLRRPVRAIVGQQRSTIDVARCLDHGRLLLVRPRSRAQPNPNTRAPTPRCTSTRCTTTSTCRPRSRRCSPKRAATGSRSASPISTSASCRRRCGKRSPPTPAPRSTSNSHPRTRTRSARSSSLNSPRTISPTCPATPPPCGSATPARPAPPSPSPPNP